ncbi:MAG: hypothetical protein HKP30_06715 [Myxococcales bacterium]|nr:hypothetical protein [Myxococcales bacterium]
MEIPRVDPVGIVEVPDGYVLRRRRLPLPLRVMAAAVLVAFATVGTVTTVATLGRYCLTSQAASIPPPGR